MLNLNFPIFYIDLFSGAGGTTTGIHLTGNPNIKVVACVNHDTNAIESHKRNHPECIHFIEDVRDPKVVKALLSIVRKLRKDYPDCIIIIWASLECTNYSKAKGGLPRDGDSRTLAHSLYMYLEALNPDYLEIENVREFMSWGPLDETGRPISMLGGKDYINWMQTVKSYGYDYDWRLLNSADYGAYTSRERYFGKFAKYGMPINWPEQTHAKNPIKNGLFGKLEKWKPVRDVLDLKDEGQSIFTRKKPLVEATLKRIYAGLVKFVAGGEKLFIAKYYSGRPEGKVITTDGPAGSITCKDGQAIVQASFLTSYYGNGDGCHSAEEPCPTVTTKDRFSQVKAQFLTNYYSGGGQLSDTDQPAPVITGVPKQRLTSCSFLDQQYGNSKPSSVDQPVGTIPANPKHNLVSMWMMNHTYNNSGNGIDQPAPTILASRKHFYLMNPQWFNQSAKSIEEPCFTLVARMDKVPPYLVETEPGQIAIEIYENDSPMMIKIKEFMALYGIVDIKMRMLKIPELKKIQGFPENYELIGSQTEQKKQLGNAVVTQMSKAIATANIEALVKNYLTLKIKKSI